MGYTITTAMKCDKCQKGSRMGIEILDTKENKELCWKRAQALGWAQVGKFQLCPDCHSDKPTKVNQSALKRFLRGDS